MSEIVIPAGYVRVDVDGTVKTLDNYWCAKSNCWLDIPVGCVGKSIREFDGHVIRRVSDIMREPTPIGHYRPLPSDKVKREDIFHTNVTWLPVAGAMVGELVSKYTAIARPIKTPKGYTLSGKDDKICMCSQVFSVANESWCDVKPSEYNLIVGNAIICRLDSCIAGPSCKDVVRNIPAGHTLLTSDYSICSQCRIYDWPSGMWLGATHIQIGETVGNRVVACSRKINTPEYKITHPVGEATIVSTLPAGSTITVSENRTQERRSLSEDKLKDSLFSRLEEAFIVAVATGKEPFKQDAVTIANIMVDGWMFESVDAVMQTMLCRCVRSGALKMDPYFRLTNVPKAERKGIN